MWWRRKLIVDVWESAVRGRRQGHLGESRVDRTLNHVRGGEPGTAKECYRHLSHLS